MTVRWRRWVADHWADPLYRQSYYLLASTAVSAGTGLLFWVVAAHRAGPDVLGVAAGLVAAVAFLSYLTSFALPYAMLRFGGAPGPVSSTVNASLAFSTGTSLVAAVVFAVVAPVSSPTLAGQLRHPVDVALFGLAGVGAGVGVLLDNLLAARRRAAAVLARNAAAGGLKLLLLALAPGDDPRALYLAVTLPALLSAVAVLAGLHRLVPGYRPVELRPGPEVRAAALFAWRNYPGSLLSGAPQFALPLLAVSVLSPRQNAFFYVAWSLAQILYLVPSVISNITLSQGAPPVAVDGPAAGSSARISGRSLRFSLVLLAPMCAVGLLLPGLVLGLYGGDYPRGAALPLRLTVVAAAPWAFVIIAQTRLRIDHRFGPVTALSAVFCVASLGLPLALAPRFGVSGLAAGWLLAVAGAAVVGWWLASGRPAFARPVARPAQGRPT